LAIDIRGHQTERLTDYQSVCDRNRMRTHRVDLNGKRIVLTGASSGIGREMAVGLADKGAQLVLAARRRDLLDEVADGIEASGHKRPIVIDTDLSLAGAAAALGNRALDAMGGTVDVVINNAGANITGAQSLIGDSARARALFEVNVWSPLALTAALLPSMMAAGSGVIVNVTSTVQAVPLPLLGYYAASKAALAQATRSLRLELAETPVRVLEVVPGSTDTALRDIDELPWKSGPPRTLPAVSPKSTAAAVVRALQRGSTRVVYPAYSLVPLELPVVGRLVARIGGRRVNTRDALGRPA
jgi:short-subunit dehydrogenase